MAQLIYPDGLAACLSTWSTDTFRVLLESTTSGYLPSIDHNFLDDFTTGGGVEISVASYSRQTIANAAKAYDNVKKQVEFDCDDIAFGTLETGESVRAAMVYRQIGGDDATPADDNLVLYDDGKVDIVCAADALLGAGQVFVQPLEANIPNGAAVDFGGGATALLTAAASRGDRSLTIDSLAAPATAGDVSAAVNSDSILPAVLQNGAFNIQINADGLFVLTQRGRFAV